MDDNNEKFTPFPTNSAKSLISIGEYLLFGAIEAPFLIVGISSGMHWLALTGGTVSAALVVNFIVKVSETRNANDN